MHTALTIIGVTALLLLSYLVLTVPTGGRPIENRTSPEDPIPIPADLVKQENDWPEGSRK